MEKRIWVHNPTKTNLHVGADIVPPGETKDFPESRVPRHLRPVEKKEEAPVEKTNPLADLLKGSVKDIVPGLDALSTADLEALGELEQLAEKPRTTLLSAIAELLLNRAAQADMLAKAAAFSDADLAVALEDAKTDINVDPDYLTALEAEAAKRNPGSAE
jgi:hypothetical protein